MFIRPCVFHYLFNVLIFSLTTTHCLSLYHKPLFYTLILFHFSTKPKQNRKTMLIVIENIARKNINPQLFYSCMFLQYLSDYVEIIDFVIAIL